MEAALAGEGLYHKLLEEIRAGRRCALATSLGGRQGAAAGLPEKALFLEGDLAGAGPVAELERKHGRLRCAGQADGAAGGGAGARATLAANGGGEGAAAGPAAGDGAAADRAASAAGAPGGASAEGAEAAIGDAGGDARLAAVGAFQAGELRLARCEGQRALFAEPWFPESRLVIFGCGHISLALAGFAAQAGFAVTVADDRPAFANRQRFPLAREVVCEDFAKAVPAMPVTPATFVVVATRGHRHDALCLRGVLNKGAAYYGMVSSRRRVAALKARLLEEGFAQERLDALHAPIGLNIRAQTPAEIAVSILAELIATKRGGVAGEWPELDMAVLGDLAEGGAAPRALVTVIETKGSVPRDVGAKMVVRADGRVTGTIGGGCTEQEVIVAARDVIRLGGCRVVKVDLTEEVSEEDEGMMCGGTMLCAIESFPPRAAGEAA